MIVMSTVSAVYCSASSALADAPPSREQPTPITGVPLEPDSGLILLVGTVPPFVLNVDTGAPAHLGEIASERNQVSTLGIGGRAAVVSVGNVGDVNMMLYGVRQRGAAVADLGLGAVVWPSNDGAAVWVQQRITKSKCELRKVALDGQMMRPARAFPCARAFDPKAGALGLVVNGKRVIAPETGQTVLRASRDIVAGTGRTLILGQWERAEAQLTLLDTKTKAHRRLRWPSALPYLGQPAVDPKGRFIALTFVDPAWNGGPQQAIDIWLLDTKTARLTHVPSMPALVSLKSTSIAWTDDRRLVLLTGRLGGMTNVAVWRLGARQLAIKAVAMPDDTRPGSFQPLG